ncbi:MAG: hypothetical protein ACJAYU_002748, partial [Bradymonadia bacterium]
AGADSGADSSETDTGADVIIECGDEVEPVDGDPCDCEGDRFDGRVDNCDRACFCEFGFWSCEETCDAPDVLALSFVGEPAVEEQTGNGDALVNPGEVWTISGSVVAANAPDEGASTSVRLRSDTIFADTDGATTDIPNLKDEPVAFSLPFSVSEDAPSAVVALTVEAFSGFATVDETVNVEVITPDVATLSWSRIEVQDAEGNPTVRIEAGDQLRITAELRNEGSVAAEAVSASASPSSSVLTVAGGDLELGVVASGGSTTAEFFVDVSDDPSELSPMLTLAATSGNTDTATEVIDISIFAPDTLEVTSLVWEGAGPDYTLVVSVRNSGRFEISGIDWSAVNYASPAAPTEPADPPQCADDADCDFGPDFSFRCDVPNATCVEDPLVVSLGLGEASGPIVLGADADATVEIPLTVTGDTPETGRLILRANSDLRSHGPFALELTRP